MIWRGCYCREKAGLFRVCLSRFLFCFQFALFVCFFVWVAVGLGGRRNWRTGEGKMFVFVSARVEVQVEGRHDGYP